jgi:hypothetical protein
MAQMKEFIARRTYNVLNNMVTMCMNHMNILSTTKEHHEQAF